MIKQEEKQWCNRAVLSGLELYHEEIVLNFHTSILLWSSMISFSLCQGAVKQALTLDDFC